MNRNVLIGAGIALACVGILTIIGLTGGMFYFYGRSSAIQSPTGQKREEAASDSTLPDQIVGRWSRTIQTKEDREGRKSATDPTIDELTKSALKDMSDEFAFNVDKTYRETIDFGRFASETMKMPRPAFFVGRWKIDGKILILTATDSNIPDWGDGFTAIVSTRIVYIDANTFRTVPVTRESDGMFYKGKKADIDNSKSDTETESTFSRIQ